VSATKPNPEGPDTEGMRAAVMSVAVTAMVLAALSGFGFGTRAAIGVLAGGALATANLAFFARVVTAFLSQKGNSAPWAILGVLKLLGLFAVAWVVLNTGVFSAIWFAVGYGSLPIGITVSSLLRKPPPLPDDGEPDAPSETPSESGGSAPTSPADKAEGTPPDADVLDAPRRD
jgi:hypothetical protein